MFFQQWVGPRGCFLEETASMSIEDELFCMSYCLRKTKILWMLKVWSSGCPKKLRFGGFLFMRMLCMRYKPCFTNNEWSRRVLSWGHCSNAAALFPNCQVSTVSMSIEDELFCMSYCLRKTKILWMLKVWSSGCPKKLRFGGILFVHM